MKKLLSIACFVVLLASTGHAQELFRALPETLHSAVAADATGKIIKVEGWATVSVHVDGIVTATVTFQVSNDAALGWHNLTCTKSSDGSLVSSLTADGAVSCPVAGYKYFKAPISGYSDGTITVKTVQTTAASRGGSGGSGSGVTIAMDTDLPASCTPGGSNALFLDTDDEIFYFCSATNTLTQFNPAEADTINTVFARGGTMTGAVSYATAFKLLDENLDGYAWWIDPTDGPQFVCVDNDVPNACASYTRTLAAGQTLIYKNSGGTNIFHLDEATAALTLGGQLVTSNLGIEFTESDTNPTCAAGNYNIYADTSETTLKKCINGTATDLVPSTLINTTLDGEGTGNTITLTEEKHWRVASCQNTTAQAVFDLFTSNTPAPTCDTGSNTQKAYLAFDATTDEAFQDGWILPTGFTGAIDVHFRWKAAATSGAVGWCAQLVRVPDAATSDPAYPAQASGNCVSDTAKGTTLQENTATISGVTCTSCAAGDHVYVRISRDANGGAVTDDMAGDAFLLTYGRTWRVAH